MSLAWFLLFLVFLIAELATPISLVSIWFCLGSLIAFVLSKVNVSPVAQTGVFLGFFYFIFNPDTSFREKAFP